jgi:PAS domain S-box-containing protein
MTRSDLRRRRIDSSLDGAEAQPSNAPPAEDSGVYLTLDPAIVAQQARRAQLPLPPHWRPRWRVSASPIPMLIFVRATGAIVAANDAAVRAYGWTHEELLESSISDLVPPTDRFVDRLLRHDHRETTWTEPLLHHRKDGTTFWGELGMIETGITKSETMAVVVKVEEPHAHAGRSA